MQFDSKDLIPLAKAGQIIPGIRHPSTVWRWVNVGRYGVKLESLEIGGVTYTQPIRNPEILRGHHRHQATTACLW